MNRNKLYLLLLLIIALLLENTSISQALPPGPDIKAQSALLLDLETGLVLYEKNAQEVREQASITKLMTYLLAKEAIGQGKIKKNDEITIGIQPTRVGGSSFLLKEGERVEFFTLIKAILIASGNDAAAAIAETISGSEEEFTNNMNQRARALGMVNTWYINASGMPKGHEENLATAEDIGILASYILKNYGEEVLSLTSQKVLEVPSRNYRKENTNRVLWEMPEVDGLKTGYTNRAGYSLVSTMEVKAENERTENFRLVGIIMGTGSEEERVEETKKLLNYGRKNFERRILLSKEEGVDKIEIRNGLPISVKVIGLEEIKAMVPKDLAKMEPIITYQENLRAPIQRGDVIGEIYYDLGEGRGIRGSLTVEEDIVKISIFRQLLRLLAEIFKLS